MIAAGLISNQLFPLKPQDECLYAREMFQVYRISDLPVVEEKKVIGILSSDQIIDISDDALVQDHLTRTGYPQVEADRHLLDLIGVFSQFDVSSLAVLNAEHEYMGIISADDVLHHIGNSLSIKQDGCIVSVKMPANSYSLFDFSRIAESENSRIIGLLITPLQDSDAILVNFKLNSRYPESFAGACERMGYEVWGSYSSDGHLTDFKDRYESLMKYLNL